MSDSAVMSGRSRSRPSAGNSRILWLVVAATFSVSLSGNTLGVAVPVVVRHFHSAALPATLIVLTPSLTSTTLMLSLGRFGDLFGRRSCYLVALAGFSVASAVLGVAPNVWAIIGLQVVQAAAVATIWANSAAILLEELPPASFRRGIGLYIAAIAVAELIGPSLGGLIAETIGWHWIFWINVPTGLACSIAGRYILPRRPPSATVRRLDGTGAILAVVGLSGLVFTISFIESTGKLSVLIVAAILASLVVIALFVAWEKRASNPLLDTAIFSDRSFSLALVAGLLNAMAEWGPVLLMVLYFQAVRGDSPLRAGLIVVPLPIMTGLLSASAGRLARYVAPEKLAVIGSLVAAGGLGMLVWALSAPYFAIAIALGIVGVGSGIFMPANANELMSRAPVANGGIVNGIRLTVQNVGWVTSTAVILTVAVSGLAGSLRHRFYSGTISAVSATAIHELVVGYRWAVAILALFALLGAMSANASRRSGSAARAAG